MDEQTFDMRGQFMVTFFTFTTVLLSFSYNRASLKSKALIVILGLIRILDNCKKFSKIELLKAILLNENCFLELHQLLYMKDGHFLLLSCKSLFLSL